MTNTPSNEKNEVDRKLETQLTALVNELRELESRVTVIAGRRRKRINKERMKKHNSFDSGRNELHAVADAIGQAATLAYNHADEVHYKVTGRYD